MNAIRVQQFGGPEVLQVAEVPDLTPGPGQVLVQLHAAGVNPVETYIRAGQYARLPALPFTPGTDGAGVITALCPEVTGWQVGQRVYLAGSITGTYASQALCEPAHLHPLPDGVSFAQGAALGVPCTTAHLALFYRGQAKSGETVLVHGATGGVGSAVVQLAAAAGLTVYGTGGSEVGREAVRQAGATAVYDHHDSAYPAKLLEATGGHGVNLIIEMLANVNLGRDLALLAPGGRVVVVGSRGPVEINPRDLMSRNSDVRGLMLFACPPAAITAAHEALVEALTAGTLKPVISREFSLQEAPQAHAAVMSAGASGKIILRIDG